MVRDRTASKWNGELAKVWWVRHEEISIDNIKDIKERAAMFWRESPPTHISNSSQSTHSTSPKSLGCPSLTDCTFGQNLETYVWQEIQLYVSWPFQEFHSIWAAPEPAGSQMTWEPTGKEGRKGRSFVLFLKRTRDTAWRHMIESSTN